jgi:hypothetical protein
MIVAMPWCEVTLRGKDSVAERESILRQFEIISAVKGNPKDAGVFMKVSEAGDLTLYFSPGAHRIAKSLIHCYDGLPCPPPKLSDLQPLVVPATFDIAFAPEG